MSFDLRNELTEYDFRLIKNYFVACGYYDPEIVLSPYDYLLYWSKSKSKLYRMLGHKFIVEIPFNYDKPSREIERELFNLLRNSDFVAEFNEFVDGLIEKNDKDRELYKEICSLYDLVKVYNLLKDTLPQKIKFKLNENDKTLQLQKGMKITRALSKVISYFGEDNFPNWEEFRLKHSMILNDKKVKGTLCISIHPLDFMTMSDNNSNWSSCMSWMDKGCYHLGTVEMMNSNNVVCCYLKASTPFVFSNNKEIAEEDRTWNNKRWRQLFYVNKDIIVGGKEYPYNAPDITKKVLEVLREYAKENFNWTYQFGPERYKDMVHIFSGYRMDRNREWVSNNTSIKHNILFDTKNMYNDMLNDNDYPYLCIRNKVKKEKIISYSGPSNCLCCNSKFLSATGYEEYNDRFDHTDRLFCDKCYEEYTCDRCNEFVGSKIKEIVFEDESKTKVCEKCKEKYIKICPDCNEPFVIFDSGSVLYNRVWIRTKPDFEIEDKWELDSYHFSPETLLKKGYPERPSFYGYYPGFCCKNCLRKIEVNNKHSVLSNFKVKSHYRWAPLEETIIGTKDFYSTMEDIEQSEASKYLYHNLKDVD